jgi:hypothetical protein
MAVSSATGIDQMEHIMGDIVGVEAALRVFLQTLFTTGTLNEDVFRQTLHLISPAKDHPTHLQDALINGSIRSDHDGTRHNSPSHAMSHAMASNDDNADATNPGAFGGTVEPKPKRKRDKVVAFAKKALPFVGILSGLVGAGATIDGLFEGTE